MGQDEEIARVYDSINGVILDFRNVVGAKQFHADDLRKFVRWHAGEIAPDSPSRIMRIMREEGKLDYEVIDRSKSLYQFNANGTGTMGRRSDFARRPHDAYQTIDPKAVKALLPFIRRDGIRTFAEPCIGEGHLARQLIDAGLVCVLGSDIQGGIDALLLPNFNGADAIISNTPWTRQLLHPLILHFQKHAPTWLLLDADWAYNVQAGPYLDHCSDIVAVGRLRWIEGTTQTGKDNVAWYRFDINHHGGPRFNGRKTMNTMPDIKPGELVGEYIKLRDAKKQFEEMASNKCRELYVDRMDAIEAQLLDLFNHLGVDSIAGKEHTAFRTTSVSVTTADGGAFREYVIAHAKWELADWKPNKTQVNHLVEAGEELPPGVNRTTFASVQIRRKS